MYIAARRKKIVNVEQRLKSQSEEIIESAAHYIAGGVVSLNRKVDAGGVVSLNRKVDPGIVFARGEGSRIYDVEGKEYIDYHAAFAPHLLGHNNERVNQAVFNCVRAGRSLYGSGTNEMEVTLAKLVCEAVPSVELVQITNTGSEATAHAIRLSRAFTGREHIVVMLGGYNGWHNDVSRLVMPLSERVGPRVERGEYPFIPSSAGIPRGVKEVVHVVNFNDLDSVEYVLKRYPVACVLTEPVLQNIGVVLPQPGYLAKLIALCEQFGTVCIFDEVKTGFRSALGGYQSVARVSPHLTVFGKAIANGYPLGVIGGKREIMELFDSPDPERRVLIAGTYNAHPLNTAAAIETLRILNDPSVYDRIEGTSRRLYTGLTQIFTERGIPMTLSRNASAFCMYFLEKQPSDLHDLYAHDAAFDLRFRRACIAKGIYHIPLACKQSSVSLAHSDSDIDQTLEVTREVLHRI
jgi:glutamate-1-semialdehyde 2,1-aminomutase